jgi:signal transduction histidine kinase/DNA-binding response OmpR family regulator
MSSPTNPDLEATADGTRALTRLYVAALSAVALLSVGGQFLIQTRLERQSADATIVNIAGRQRMISQRLAKCALSVAAAPTAAERVKRATEIRELLPLWRRCHQGLQKGDAALEIPFVDDPQAATMFREIDPSFQVIYDGASDVLTELDANRPVSRRAVDAILAREAEFLHGMDRIVSYYEMEAQKRVTRLGRVESILLALTLTVLLCEGALVFRPATRRSREAFAALRRTHEELRLAKNAAEAANQAKTRFLANVSHELRTPLHAVLGGVELLEQTRLDDRGREYARMIDDAARAQLGLVNDLLDLTMIEAGKAELRPQSFHLPDMVERTCTMLRPMAAARGLALRCRIDEAVPRGVVGDELRLRQVLVNLINNAIKFTDSGTIDCRVVADARVGAAERAVPVAEGESVRVRFEVADTGIGIDESDRQHIFDRFTQIDESSERRRGGAGLGLAICAQWVERMGGRIDVDGRIGEGSRFSFELLLPVGTALAPVAHRLGRSASAVGPLRILLADDAPAGRLIVAELLRQAGHEVVAAADGRDAIAAYSNGRFDAALLDIQMPGLDGPGAVAAIRLLEQAENRPRMPIAALTADLLPRDSRQLEKAGFDAKLTKPITAAALLEAIEKLVANAGAPTTSKPFTEFEAQPPRETATPSQTSSTYSASALERVRGNRRLMAELAEMFSTEAATAIERLKSSLADDDGPAAYQTAHRLRGQLLLLGADEAARIAEAIESESNLGRTESAAARLPDLITALDRICPAGKS